MRRTFALGTLLICIMASVLLNAARVSASTQPAGSGLDHALEAALRAAGFTGRVEASLERRLGRRIDQRLAEVGRMLWFDSVTGLNNDNSCAGCHSPTSGFGDTQSIAIGIQNNGIVGPNRAGPRNMRRAP